MVGGLCCDILITGSGQRRVVKARIFKATIYLVPMRKLCLLLLLSLPFCLLNAQCECPPLPDDQTDRMVVIADNVIELRTALSNCNADGGNYTILLENGSYNLGDDLLYINGGMANLTIRSLSGERDSVLIMGQGYDGPVQYIFNVAADNFTLADVTIGQVMYHGVQIHGEHDADNCLIQNVRFVDIQEQMLKVSGSSSSSFSDGGVVQCCLFEFTDGVGYQWYTGGIDAHHAKDWEVRYNTFKHIRSPDSGLAEHAIHFWSASENTLVENNLIIDCDRGIGFGLGSSSHVGGIIRNNFVHTSRDVGIGLESSSDTKIYHNTVVTDNYFNSIEYRFEATTGAHIANNLTTEAVASRNGGTGTVESNFETSNLDLFTNPQAYDYHLNEMAPASVMDAGMVLQDAGLDFDCHPRDTDGTPDIGADEFGSVINSIDDTPDGSIILIYPNPSRDVVYVSSEQPLQLVLRQLNGQVIWTGAQPTGQGSVRLSGLPSGVYLLELQGEKSWEVRKVVKE